MSNVKSYSLEELAKHQDTTLSNVNRYVSERDYIELQQRNAELAAQVDALRQRGAELINSTGGIIVNDAIWKAAGMAYGNIELQDVVGNLATSILKTPNQHLTEHDREVAARAGKAGFIAGAMSGANWEYSGRYEISEDAEQYANKIKSGEVEL